MTTKELLTYLLTKTRYKFCKIRENCARDTPLRGVYIPHFNQISVKTSVLGVLYPSRMGLIWHRGGALCQISPYRCNVSPLRGEKP